MKKFFALLAALLLALAPGLGSPALSETELSYEGSVVAGETVPVSVPYGGRVDEMLVRVGSWIREGDPIATLATTLNYAPIEGTVTGLNAGEGDSAETVAERYGAVLFLEPTHRYMLEATEEKAYNNSENHYLHLGERVWLTCVADGSHKGTGMISAFTESGFNIEVTGGEFYLEEKVDIFRTEDRTKESRIGRGTVKRSKPLEIKATGSILKMHVKNGDYVERGELLFETVEGVLDGMYAPQGSILCPETGVVTSVEKAAGDTVGKGETLIKVAPVSGFQVQFDVPESDVFALAEGQTVSMELYWDNMEAKNYEGVITSISFVNEEQKADSGSQQKVYKACASFKPDERIRLGMTVIVYPGAAPAAETPEENLTEEKEDED